MNALLKILNKFQYPQKSWTYAKAITIVMWLAFVLLELQTQHTGICNTGACRYFNCVKWISSPYYYLLIPCSITTAIFYICEKYMRVSLVFIVVISIVVFSVGNSEGNRLRSEILSMVFIAQLIAYVQYGMMNEKFRMAATRHNLAMFYSIQIIACCYVISAICKMQSSGLMWFINAPNVALKIMVSYISRGLDFNLHWPVAFGHAIANFVLAHPIIARIAFVITFLVELFAFVAIAGRKQARYYGMTLLAMHFFMLLVMGIVVIPFIVIAIAYLINLKDKDTTAIVALNRDNALPFSPGVWLLRLFLPIVFIVVSLKVGENYPFSRYPMFKTMEPATNFYRLQDSAGNSLSPLKLFGIRTDQLQNLVNDAAFANHVELKNSAALATVSMPVLSRLVTIHAANLKARNIEKVSVLSEWLWIENGRIMHGDTVLAEVKIGGR